MVDKIKKLKVVEISILDGDKKTLNVSRPIPILKGKAAKRFYKIINQGKISEKQNKFLKDCVKLSKKTKRTKK